MKKLFFAAWLVLGVTVFAYAESSSEAAKQVAAELQDSGSIAAADVSTVKSSVKTLIDNGATKDEAKNVVSRAAHQAKQEGLRGKELAAKVHEAVKARKAELKEAKNKVKEEAKKKTKEAKQKAEKEKKKLKEKTDKAKKSMNKKQGW